jgi:DNA gyrase subunit B/topoisomerase-4 subunit B
MSDTYTVKDIQVLKGLDAIRKRPGMYIGGTGPAGLHQLVWETLDNAVDEALNGHCGEIVVRLLESGAIQVQDTGRGIPVEKHPVTGKNTVETIFCNLHAGGKFDEYAYKVAGGLHGVGASVVNALSESLEVEVRRNHKRYVQKFSRGNPVTKLTRKGPAIDSGTTVTFLPDEEIFETLDFSVDLIRERLQTKAYLIAGLTIKLIVEETGEQERFYYPLGISDYLKSLTQGRPGLEIQPFHFSYDNGIRVNLVMTWTQDTAGRIMSFVNSIPTTGGGAHETAFKNGVTKALRTYLERKDGLPKGIKGISAEDAREGMYAVLSVYLQGNLEFQGQTKEKLNSPAAQQIEPLIKTALENWLHQNPSQASVIMNRVILAAQARTASRAAREEVTRKAATRRLTLPGKLADCSSTSRDDTELFIVEGESAGGSSKQARDRKYQAILPLKGKILNVEQASADKLRSNKEIQSLIQSIGSGIGRDFDYSKLRYGKIIINTDADVDGHHIATLLLTFFYRHMTPLVEKGHLFLAVPPLYRITVGSGKKAWVTYVFSDKEKDKILREKNGKKVDVQRFKGLGEMDANALKKTTMDPGSRKLLKISVEDPQKAESVFDTLMGKDAKKRYSFIREHAEDVEDLDL